MTASTRREPLTALDQLTEDLVPKANQVARRLDRVMLNVTGKLDLATVCGWCLEANGWCTATGGPHPCEYGHEAAEAFVELHAAPEIGTAFGGAR